MNPDSRFQIGYCTNVHAGTTLADVKRNLTEYSLAIKNIVSPELPFGIGMWLSAASADQLVEPAELETLKTLLQQHGLVPFTFNGFPYGNFHQPVVKKAVYLPNWSDKRRLEYTIQLANIQSQLLPPGELGSISTLPLAWPTGGFSKLWNPRDDEVVKQSALNLKKCAEKLSQLHEQTGRKIRIAIEPEPGCLIDNCVGVVEFFDQFLFDQNSTQSEKVREYIGICHDVCHSAVMFESQEKALKLYADNQIQVVKVQVSSAIAVKFDELDVDERKLAVRQLARFGEDRYLHQTNIRRNGQIEFFEDLPLALERASYEGEWRIHFHVPVFVKQFGLIGTTQSEILNCLRFVRELHPDTNHFEIETYAWNVLPEDLRTESLRAGIAKEIEWFNDLEGVSRVP